MTEAKKGGAAYAPLIPLRAAPIGGVFFMNGSFERRLRLGLIGGGEGAFIGAAHIAAASLDNRATLVAGTFSSQAAKSKAAASVYGIDLTRAYGNTDEMFAAEAARTDGVDVFINATPNYLHEPIGVTGWGYGFHWASDKPLTHTVESARRYHNAVTTGGKPGQQFLTTFNYSNNAMPMLAAEMIANGDIGVVHRVRSSYIQGWLDVLLEATAAGTGGQKQADWRTDPAKAGAGAFGDIGTHAFVLALLMARLKPKRVRAKLGTLVKGRKIDDHGVATVECEGVDLTVEASQVCSGHLNDLVIAVHGTKGSLHWRQEAPGELHLFVNGQPKRTYNQGGGDFMLPAAKWGTRMPGGHPEAWFEGMANAYRRLYDRIVAAKDGAAMPVLASPYTGIDVGLAANEFVHACQQSSAADESWVPLDASVFSSLF